MRRLFLIIALALFAASDLFAKSPSLQTSDIEKYTNLWQNFLSQYDAFLENYEATHPQAQALEKKVQMSYTRMREAYSVQYSRCSKMYKKHIDSGVKKGAPMVKDLELEIDNLRVIGGKMKKTMTIDQQKDLAKWLKDNKLPQKLGEVQLVDKSAAESAPPQKTDKPSSAETIKAGDRLVKVINGVEFAFRYCPAGKFMMGSPETEEGRGGDELQHEVTLTKGFWMMETEVTQKQWQAIMGNNPSNHKGDDLPVEMVSWYDCQNFCKKCADLGLPLQLPTEAQWEYACRAGTTGARAGNLDEMAWYDSNSNGKPHPVGTKKSNAWGLFDMIGNVTECCEDWMGNYPNMSVTDPTGPSSGKYRVRRGGCFGDKDYRSARRGCWVPEFRQDHSGFRCIASETWDPSKTIVDNKASAFKAGDRIVRTINGTEFAFRYCPAGKFIMGSPETEEGRDNDEQQHEVTLSKGFWIMETEVTQKQWQTVMGNNPSKNIGDDLPVEMVTWGMCQDFCKKCSELGVPMALPTEAQWEYACRAGTTGAYAGELSELGWYNKDWGQKSRPVGTKKPNPWGIYDMHGNVWERCADWIGDYPSGPVTDPVGPAEGTQRVRRGGSTVWDNQPRQCRSAERAAEPPIGRNNFTGFRCVLSNDFDPSKSVDVKSGNASQSSQPPGALVDFNNGKNAGDRAVKTVNGVEFTFRFCPAGKFMMGSPASEKGRNADEVQHEVTLTKGFWMMETQVTQKQWQAIMGNNPSRNIGENNPVEQVSWNDCQEFCKKCVDLGFPLQLPTEAQWEYACRAGTTEAFTGELNDIAWYRSTGGGRLHPVAMKKPNAWGLYDMIGNVWEWCQDWKANYPNWSVTDPAGPSSGTLRVNRGGGYGSWVEGCRSAYRGGAEPEHVDDKLGFRCVKAID